MKLARIISYSMTIAGVAITLVAAALDLSPVVTLAGMLLFVAGVVKIGMVAIWRAFFAIPIADSVTNSTRTSSEKHEA